MNTIKLYNSYTGKIEEFKPIKEREVNIYYCGPTVYNYVHLGNFRPTVTFDVLSRVFKEVGYNVKLVSNYTDIDDKIIKQAKIENKTEKQLSEFYIEAYEELLDKLNVEKLYAHPKASEYIEKMAIFIDELKNMGYAYYKNNDTFFRINKVLNYGKLSKQTIKDLESGKRIEENSDKESPLDFVLWKLTDDEGIKFDTLVGRGRPGWHTECVCMVNSIFHSPLIDIHGGGFDLKFPHHENEIAQSLAHNGTILANYWMHCGFLLTNGEKMSKSLGNSILAKDVLNRHTANAVRLFFLSTPYRSPVNYEEEILNSFDDKDKKIHTSLKKAKYKLQLEKYKFNNLIDKDIYNEFISYLCDDLKTSNAITILERCLKNLNSLLAKKDSDNNDILLTYNTILKLSSILGLRFIIDDLTNDDISNFNLYNEARNNKDYEKSDIYRKKLIEKGIL